MSIKRDSQLEKVVGELPKVLDELIMLLTESANYHRNQSVRAALLDASQTVYSLRRRLDLVAGRYVVAVVGLTNVGKSTLLNALLGKELAPRRNRPCTAAPIEFAYGPELRVIAHYEHSVSRRRWKCVTFEALHERLSALAEEGGEHVSRDLAKLVVEAPLDLLKNGLVIADTPGFGAAQTEEGIHAHEAILREYLRKQVSQVFWVVLADQGIGRREKQFYDDFLAEVCDDLVVTGCEDWDQNDRQRFRQRFSQVFANHIPRFHFVSGLQGVRARQTSDPVLLEEAGISLLEQRIRELEAPQGRYRALEYALLDLADDLRYWLSEFRDERGLKLISWWRPDSWARWAARLADNGLKRMVQQKLEQTS